MGEKAFWLGEPGIVEGDVARWATTGRGHAERMVALAASAGVAASMDADGWFVIEGWGAAEPKLREFRGPSAKPEVGEEVGASVETADARGGCGGERSNVVRGGRQRLTTIITASDKRVATVS